eukprot:39978-Eustigmatos_ZCMA.PRE.1
MAWTSIMSMQLSPGCCLRAQVSPGLRSLCMISKECMYAMADASFLTKSDASSSDNVLPATLTSHQK